jgi:hypothetical protein
MKLTRRQVTAVLRDYGFTPAEMRRQPTCCVACPCCDSCGRGANVHDCPCPWHVAAKEARP